jgi:hypothetical protein
MTDGMQHILDRWFPTLVRYAGLVLAGIEVYLIITTGVEHPGLWVAATGMFFYKSVVARSGSADANGKS